MAKPKSSVRRRAIALGYRSGLEEHTSTHLTEHSVEFEYEQLKISYVKPQTKHTYTPDFFLRKTGVIIETKGRFVLADRQKHLLIKDQHPELDIRFVFSNAYTKLTKTSKTSYADWCDKHGFAYAHKEVPDDWIP